MRLGYTSMNTPDDIPLDALASGLEARGFDSLWIGEHSHIPTSRDTPYPAGGELPPQYLRMMDPYVSLMQAASTTSTLLLGTGVALPLERDLLALAKIIATLDRLCGGRFQFGVGVGWNEEELRNHRPIPWNRRYRALSEAVAALRTLWSVDEPEFHGMFYDFDRVWSYPKPLQQPHPPILCGMAGRTGTEHAIAWADAWMPMDIALGDVAKRVGRFQNAVAAAGRAPVPISIVTWGDPTPDTLATYRDLGVERVVLGAARAAWDDPGTTMGFLDRYAAYIDALA
jgi:probable F420-dependent oxidoreductase